jgi:hypothetical protein
MSELFEEDFVPEYLGDDKLNVFPSSDLGNSRGPDDKDEETVQSPRYSGSESSSKGSLMRNYPSACTANDRLSQRRSTLLPTLGLALAWDADVESFSAYQVGIAAAEVHFAGGTVIDDIAIEPPCVRPSDRLGRQAANVM